MIPEIPFCTGLTVLDVHACHALARAHDYLVLYICIARITWHEKGVARGLVRACSEACAMHVSRAYRVNDALGTVLHECICAFSTTNIELRFLRPDAPGRGGPAASPTRLPRAACDMTYWAKQRAQYGTRPPPTAGTTRTVQSQKLNRMLARWTVPVQSLYSPCTVPATIPATLPAKKTCK